MNRGGHVSHNIDSTFLCLDFLLISWVCLPSICLESRTNRMDIGILIIGLAAAAETWSLEDCIALAMNSNLELKADRQTVAVRDAELAWQQDQRWYDLTARLQGGYVNDRAGLAQRGQAEFHLLVSQLGIGANLLLYDGGTSEVLEQISEKRVQFARAKLSQRAQIVVEQMALLYPELLVSQKRVEIQKLEYKKAKILAAEARADFRGGRRYRRHLLTRQMALEEARGAVEDARQQHNALAQAFAEALGHNPADSGWNLTDRLPVPNTSAANALEALSVKEDIAAVERSIGRISEESALLQAESQRSAPLNIALSGNAGVAAIRDLGRQQTLIGPSIYLDLKMEYALIHRVPSPDPLANAQKELQKAQSALLVNRRQQEVTQFVQKMHGLVEELSRLKRLRALSEQLVFQTEEMEKRGDASKFEIQLAKLNVKLLATRFAGKVAKANQAMLGLFVRIDPKNFVHRWQSFADKHQLSRLTMSTRP